MSYVKHCPGCDRHLMVAIPSSPVVAFNRKRGTWDGYQPYCRTCDWHGKTTLEEAWNRFGRTLTPHEQTLWTFEIYLGIVGDDPRCNWCGSSCREWGIGHWIDRISSDYGHITSNCVACCTPCNFHKGHKPQAVHEQFLRSLLRSCSEFPSGTGRHPWGKIPWNENPSSSRRFERVAAPDLTAHVREIQLGLGLCGGSTQPSRPRRRRAPQRG